MQKLLYLIGHQSSGKSFLKEILSLSSNQLLDTGSVHKYYMHNNKLRLDYSIKNFDELNIDRFVLDLYSDPRIDRWQKIDRNMLKKMINNYKPSNYQEIMNILFCCNAGYNKMLKDVYWIIDNRLMTNSINNILKESISSKIIHVVRDPREIHYSFYNERSDRYNKKQYKSLIRAIYWNNYVYFINHRQEKYPHRILTVRFEDIIHDSVNTLSSIFTFLDVNHTNTNRNSTSAIPNIARLPNNEIPNFKRQNLLFGVISGKSMRKHGYGNSNIIIYTLSYILHFLIVTPFLFAFTYDSKFNLFETTSTYKIIRNLSKNIFSEKIVKSIKGKFHDTKKG